MPLITSAHSLRKEKTTVIANIVRVKANRDSKAYRHVNDTIAW